MYQINFGEAPSRCPVKALNTEGELGNARFDSELNHQLSLPLSNPGTPLNPETDIAIGSQRLRSKRLFLEDEVLWAATESANSLNICGDHPRHS